MTYPDNEIVVYQYDQAGQVIQVRNAGGSPVYLSNLTYDIFGRSRVISHGDSTTDTRTYGQAGTNYRLQSIKSEWTGVLPPVLNYSYAAYTPTGQLAQLNDLRNPSGVYSNTATYTYDGLGRLIGASGPNLPAPNTYRYDTLGNITLKEGTTFTYNPTKPHQLATINGSSSGIAYDDNGNRTGKPGQIYAYDAEDRLTAVNTTAVQMRYDYTGRQVLKATAAGSVMRYFSEFAESGSDGTLTKYYFAAGLRIASQQISWQPQQVASVPAAVQVARVAVGRPVLLLMVRADVQRAAAAGLAALFIGLLLMPGRQRRVVGIAVRRGHVLVVLLAWTVGTLPLPLIVRPFGATPAWAGAVR